MGGGGDAECVKDKERSCEKWSDGWGTVTALKTADVSAADAFACYLLSTSRLDHKVTDPDKGNYYL